jgi:hypothetical protein
MLDLAEQRLQSAGVPGARVALHHGYVQSALAGPIDGATCLLTLHLVQRPPWRVCTCWRRSGGGLSPARRWWWRI